MDNCTLSNRFDRLIKKRRAEEGLKGKLGLDLCYLLTRTMYSNLRVLQRYRYWQSLPDAQGLTLHPLFYCDLKKTGFC